MRIRIGKSHFFLVFLIVFIACNSGHEKQVETRKKLTKKELEEVNKRLVQKDNEVIQSYCKRRGWEMKTTESGLWFQLIEAGEGLKAEKGMLVTLSYRIELLDGTVCYDSREDGLKEFIIGQGGVESGLEEGILMMHKGGEARFIMPPHLAHGLLGDGKRIPSRSVIVYFVELLDLKK